MESGRAISLCGQLVVIHVHIPVDVVFGTILVPLCADSEPALRLAGEPEHICPLTVTDSLQRIAPAIPVFIALYVAKQVKVISALRRAVESGRKDIRG